MWFVLIKWRHDVVVVLREGYSVVKLAVVKLALDDDLGPGVLAALEQGFPGVKSELALVLVGPVAIVALSRKNGDEDVVKDLGLGRIDSGESIGCGRREGEYARGEEESLGLFHGLEVGFT